MSEIFAFHFGVPTLGFHLGCPSFGFQLWGSWGSTFGALRWVSHLRVPALGSLWFHLGAPPWRSTLRSPPWGSTLGVPPFGFSHGVPGVPPWGSNWAFHFGGPTLEFYSVHWGSHLWFQPGFMGFHLGVPPWGSHLWVPCLRVPVALGGPTFVFQPPWRPTLGGLTLGFHPGGPTFGL
jgi:hypothetical protein